ARCGHWDRHSFSFSPGASKSQAPTQDHIEDTWRSYYASIFNPARLKTKAMQTEMPKKYWRNPPEASLSKPLIERAEKTVTAMIKAPALDSTRSPQRQQAMEMTKAHRNMLSKL